MTEVLERNRRVIAVANVKGGVGKTSITANLSAELAAGGYKVLAVDLDPQGNLRNILGYRDSDIDDAGEGLLRSVTSGDELHPAKNVRERLDVVAGGIRSKDLQRELQRAAMDGGDVTTKLATSLAQISHRYDIVLLDTPPSPGMLQTSALVAARYVIIPVEADEDSLDGVETMAGEIRAVRSRNPLISPLGVVRFRMRQQATRAQSEIAEGITELLGEGVAFDTIVRDAHSVARIGKAQGMTARELGTNPPSAAGVAADYHHLSSEVLKVIQANEERLAQKEAQA